MSGGIHLKIIGNLLALGVIVISFLTASGCRSEVPTTELQFTLRDGKRTPVIQAEVVYTPKSREVGLMYRKELAPNRGMLFIFPQAEPRRFWMRNTYLELDIIFVDEEFRVTNVVERAEPLTETPRESAAPAMYVVEVPGGSAAAWGLHRGAELKITGPLPSAR